MPACLVLDEAGGLLRGKDLLLVIAKVEEVAGEGAAVREAGLRLVEVIEEGVGERGEGLDAVLGDVREELRAEVVGLDGDVGAKNLAPLLGADIGEAGVAGAVELLQLLAGGRAEDLDDLDELPHRVLAAEDRVANHHLREDAAYGPDIDGGAIVGVAEDELGGAVVAGADVGHVRLVGEHLGAAKVA